MSSLSTQLQHLSSRDVLYEDNHLIAVWKRPGILTQADASGEPSLMDETKDYLKRVHHKPGNVFLGLLHRLDREACGIVLFAKTSKGASRLSAQFRSRQIEKRYLAVVEGVPSKTEAELIHYWEGKDRPSEIFESPRPGRKEARLSYRTLHSENGRSVLEVLLLTGRKHQIRAQLSHMGTPIVGDRRYGSQIPSAGIALMACELCFRKATQESKIHLRVPETDRWVRSYLQ